MISAGGTLIKPAIARDGRTGSFVDISTVPGLAEITRANGALAIGALVHNQTLLEDRGVTAWVPALAHAARSIGNPAVRRAGTIGGNVACRLPRASLPPALLVYDARARIAARDGMREVPIADVLMGGAPGDGLVTAIVVPVDSALHVAFDKLAWRGATAKAVTSAAIGVRIQGGVCRDVRIAVGGLCVARRLPRAEACLQGRKLDDEAIAETAAIAAAEPPFEVTDVPAGEPYRRRAVGLAIARMLGEVPRG